MRARVSVPACMHAGASTKPAPVAITVHASVRIWKKAQSSPFLVSPSKGKEISPFPIIMQPTLCGTPGAFKRTPRTNPFALLLDSGRERTPLRGERAHTRYFPAWRGRIRLPPIYSLQIQQSIADN